MVLLKATKDTEAGVMPSAELLAAMGRFNQEMLDAGVLIDGAGLRATSKGARIRFSGTQRTVIDGPFPEPKELIAGYWMLQVQSKEEAIQWIKRCPHPHEGADAEIEIRRVFEIEDFANAPEDVVAMEERHREKRARN
jgi:hypothetical protein